MIYPPNFEEKIDFDKIKALLHSYTLGSLGKARVDALFFVTDKQQLQNLIGCVADAKEILENDADFPISRYTDLCEQLKKIRVEGTFLDVEELFELKNTVETLSALVAFIVKQEEGKALYLKAMLTQEQHTYPYIKELLGAIVARNGKIKDNASQELRRIRSTLLGRQQSVSKLVNRLLLQAKKEGWTPENTEATMRDGRLVIPVEAAYKRKLSGIIHDESATGKTSYIEPAEIVSVNNEIRELLYEERREILKILVDTATKIRPYIDELLISFEFLSEIDFIRAKALFATDINAIKPLLSEKPLVQWKLARHPVLELNMRKEKKMPVPLTIRLGAEKRILVISGPNAGGKSICLKTVGLLQYMLQTGLLVPVEEGSQFGMFNNIFIDIGDEQSIENELSTYSSHLQNMKQFTTHADNHTLLLIDEFGTGTEPLLGGAIAESVLQTLNEKRVAGVITTHYSNLKHFASENEGIVNGAMLYDTQNMTPLYKLEIGTPGSSFAFEIATKIGLSGEILDRAKKTIGEEQVDFDSHLKEVVENRLIWQKKRFKISQQEKDMEFLLRKYQRELEEIKTLKKGELEKAKEKAKILLEQANKTIEKTIKTIAENKANKSVTKTVRAKFEKEKKQLLKEQQQDAFIEKKIEQIKKRQQQKKNKKQILEQQTDKPQQKEKIIEVGTLVRTRKTQVVGEILDISGNQVTIAVGGLKMRVPLNDLEYVGKNQAKRSAKNRTLREVQKKVFDKRMSFEPDLDVRGFSGVDAIKKVAEHVDNALMLGLGSVRVLHGTGYGILRKMIREYLAKQIDVQGYRDEHIDHGGSGITIIDL